jgi:gluconolactonase
VSAQIRDRRFGHIVAPEAACEKLAGGFLFTEGPLWDPRDNSLLFSDMPGDEIRRWHAGGVTSFRKPSRMANGLAWDREGQLLCCEHATSCVTRTGRDGRVTVIASHYRGKELNSPNDIVVRSDGAIYFTDPSYGRMAYYGVARPEQLGFRGVYRLAPGGAEPMLLADDFAQPNGLCFSADERRLFVNDTERGHVRVFDVDDDGALSGSKVWVQLAAEGPGGADGMKLDSEGHLFCCGPGGIHVFDRSAACLGIIRVPEGAANFAWGGDDLRDLFITATSSLYRIRVLVPGRRSLR